MRVPELDEGGQDAWKDVVAVTVPAKTKRRTVIAKAVEEGRMYNALAGDGPIILRVIPAEHAEPIKVEMEQPPPQLRIG